MLVCQNKEISRKYKCNSKLKRNQKSFALKKQTKNVYMKYEYEKTVCPVYYNLFN